MLALVKLYKELFQTGLTEARLQVEPMTHYQNHPIPVAEADIPKAAHFVYQARQFGAICELRSTVPSSGENGAVDRSS